MEIRAVAPLVVACPHRVAASPARSRLVVLHRFEDVLVDRVRLLQIGARTQRFLRGKLRGKSRYWHEFVRHHEAIQRCATQLRATTYRLSIAQASAFAADHVVLSLEVI